MNTVFLNAGKLDFDRKLDFSLINSLTTVTKYEGSEPDEILARVEGQDIIITKELPLGKELISRFPSSVKLICEAGTGYNNIDLNAAREKDIKVCNVPGYSTEAVAQLVITFILSLSSSLTRQQRMLEQKDYSNFTEHLRVPHYEIQHKTLGVIGLGSIGSQAVKVAQVLGMKVLAYTRTPRPQEGLKIDFVGLEEMLQRSDFVSIHCPLTEQTKYLINKDRLKLMKPTSYIINTARGQIINEGDLIEALKAGVIAGAALDVQDPEPPETSNPLFNMDNVILTPHIGWKCLESRQRLLELMGKNIKYFVEGNPINVVG